MSRIPAPEPDRLKREVSLVRLVETSGVELKKHGKDYLRCPFHDDKTPSLVVSPAKNLWHFLGACGEGGDVIAWVMKHRGVSFRHAAELLRDGDAALPVPATPVQRTTTVEHPAPSAADADDQAQLERVIAFFHETLKQSPEALASLDNRGLNDPDMIAHFKLGLANRTLGYRLPDKRHKTGAAIEG